MIPKQDRRSACADKNDNLGWTCGASVEYGGRVLGIRTDDQDLLQELLSLLPDIGSRSEEETVNGLFSIKKGGAGKSKGVRHYFVLYDGWTRVARTMDKTEALLEFKRRWTASLASIAHMETIVTREALVMEKDGRATAYLGVPGENLKRVQESLGEQGLTLVSDLALVLNLEGKVRGLHSTAKDIEKLRSDAFELGSVYFFEAVREVQAISPGQGALRLVSKTIGNAALAGEMAALANAFRNASCKIVPIDSDPAALLPVVA